MTACTCASERIPIETIPQPLVKLTTNVSQILRITMQHITTQVHNKISDARRSAD